MLALLLVVVFGNRLLLTGDEQRYLLYALSSSRHGTLTMPLAEWNQVMLHLTHGGATSLPAGAGGAVVMNGIYWPVILSPVAGLFSLTGLRAATLLAGLAGLAVLHRLLRRVAGPSASLAALFIVAFSMPLLPYLHLFYMETFLFALVCWAWQRLQTTGRGVSDDLLTAAILIVIPIVHMRGSGVAALLFAGLLVQVLGRRLWRRAGLLLTIAATSGNRFRRSQPGDLRRRDRSGEHGQAAAALGLVPGAVDAALQRSPRAVRLCTDLDSRLRRPDLRRAAHGPLRQ